MTQIRRVVKKVREKITKMPTCENEMPFENRYAVLRGKRVRQPRLTQTTEVPLEKGRPCPNCAKLCKTVAIKRAHYYSVVDNPDFQGSPHNLWVAGYRYECPECGKTVTDAFEVEILNEKSVT